jgi:hypothetical protein
LSVTTISRIKAIGNGNVTYTWRDRSQQNIEKTETIPAALFTRRFLAHILPNGFHKIRYFGWMAAAHRKEILAAIRQVIHAQPPTAPAKETLAARILRRCGVDITLMRRILCLLLHTRGVYSPHKG